MKRTVLTAVVLLALAVAAGAQDKKLVVGTKPTPPFAMKDGNGEWTGLTVELWRKVTESLGRPTEFVDEKDIPGLLGALEDGSIDAAVAAMTVNAEREEKIDFTHPFFHTGLGIAVPSKSEASWVAVLRKLVSPEFLSVLGALTLLLLGMGFVVWIAERKKNPEQFGGTPAHGLAAGFWWSAVTMTTVGYGDKAPTTVLGRIVGLVWMFAAIIVISSFTATIASTLTISELASPVTGPDDLPKVRVGSVHGTTSAGWLDRRGLAFTDYGNTAEALDALARGEVGAVVYDQPILRYLAKKDHPGELTVLPVTFERQQYAIALPQGSELRETLNVHLLEVLSSSWWQEQKKRYFGE